MSKENSIKTHICQICLEELSSKGFNSHLRHKHNNLTVKEYFDKFFKKDNDGICLTCNKETKFYGLRGYYKFCSSKCCNSNEITRQKTTKTFRKTLEDNPEILIKRIENYKKWCRDNPDTVSKSIRKYYNGFKHDSTKPYYLYFVRHLDKSIVKIGKTGKPNQRLTGLIKDFGICEIFYLIKDNYVNISKLENYLHKCFDKDCIVQESGNGRTEWFDNKILEEAISIASSNEINLT